MTNKHTVPFVTPGVMVLMGLALAGIGVLAVRLIWGLGTVTNLNDQYPWGIWIGIDVATGVALAAGGFTTAFVAHVLHRNKYHDVVRPALLTAMLGYTFVGLGVCVDLGRYYNIWHFFVPNMINGDSALFEVAPDGERFLVARDVQDEDANGHERDPDVDIVVVLNWHRELERLAPADP